MLCHTLRLNDVVRMGGAVVADMLATWQIRYGRFAKTALPRNRVPLGITVWTPFGGHKEDLNNQSLDEQSISMKL
jgi:hypothetical protein